MVIILKMASHTGVGRINVIALVTTGALVGNRCVTAIECPIIIVIGQQGWIPARICRVTLRAIHRKAQGEVAWILALIEIVCMTGFAFSRGALETICMTTETINIEVRACQRESGSVMIKSTVCFPVWMTG